MKNRNSFIAFTLILFLVAAAGFVYLNQLRIEMTIEAGWTAGAVISKEQKYFDVYGEFAALEESGKSEALGINLSQNDFFTLMRAEVVENTVIFYAVCPKGFFRGTEVYAKYNNKNGMTEYEIRERSKIPLPRL